MTTARRVALWFGAGLENALAARALLGQLQAEHPGAEWVLFGPRESLFMFEMDSRVSVYIPLRSTEPRRAAQSRLSYFLEKRAQFKKLKELNLDECVGVSARQADTKDQFQHILKIFSVSGAFIQKDLSSFLSIHRPELQAGPQALAFATQLHRKSPPHLSKLLVLLVESERPALEAQWLALQNALNTVEKAHTTVAVITNNSRLAARQLAGVHPDWLQLDFAQAMGLIAYADRVICLSSVVTQICEEMGRSDRVLLGKSHS